MYLHPFVEFLYWHMNFHTEHHLYAAVPCYNLGRLHEAIKHDLPPTPNGLAKTWRRIIEIQCRQLEQPDYRYNPALPGVDDAKAPATETKPTTLPWDKTGDASNESADGPGRLWECSVCGFVYSERLGLPDEGIPPGTAWEDIPEDWKCPDCGTSKAEFQMVEVSRVANATVF